MKDLIESKAEFKHLKCNFIGWLKLANTFIMVNDIKSLFKNSGII